ncbi:MAG TPA: ROK family protein, partial [Actinomycetota bacterium]|nr:ROK family protein [Actinomycetota bacterium]
LTPKRVFAAARRGDERARWVVSTVAEGIALAIAAVVPILDPELVVLGGGIGRNGDLLLEPVRRELRGISPFLPRIEVSPLGDDATVVGAVAMALSAARERLWSRHGPVMRDRRGNGKRTTGSGGPEAGVSWDAERSGAGPMRS